MNNEFTIKDGSWFEFFSAADSASVLEDPKTVSLPVDNEIKNLYNAIKQKYMNEGEKKMKHHFTIDVGDRAYRVGLDDQKRPFIYQSSGVPTNLAYYEDKNMNLTVVQHKQTKLQEIVVMTANKKFEKVKLPDPVPPPAPPEKKGFFDKFKKGK